ncbi:MAG: NAD-dependent epimerase/dehydratase family protein [Spirochaetes bacterium]|nr:NAD-dependent epimerase/dehydratase family protein [Spirochaetota bacterium]
MEKKKILILGINGFIGRAVLKYINRINNEYHFIYVDQKKNRSINKNFFKVNLLKIDKLKHILKKEKPDHILDLVGINYSRDITDLYKVNHFTKINLYEAVLSVGNYSPRILIIGSAAEYGEVKSKDLPVKESSPCEPITHYGISKLSATHTALAYNKNHNMKIIIARPFNLLGPHLGEKLSISSFIKQLKEMRNKSRVLKVGNIETKRDFLHVEDAVDAIFKILLKGKPSDIYNICSGRSIKIRKIIMTLTELLGMEKIRIAVQKERIKKGDVKNIYGDNRKLKKIGWKPQHDLNKALSDMI